MEGQHLYTEACKREYQLMQTAIEFSLKQRRRDGAFKPSMVTLDSMQTRSMAQGFPPTVIMVVIPYIRIAMPINEQNLPIAAGVLSGTTQASNIRRIDNRLGSLALGTMPRSRGVPRRGGRSGIRVGPELEELHPISPMASAPPSSPSSE